MVQLLKLKLGHVLDALFNSGNSHNNNNINGGAGQILWIDKDTMYMPNVKLETAFTDPFFAQSLPRDYLQVFNSKKIIKWLSKYTPTFITSSSNPNGIWNMLRTAQVKLFYSQILQKLTLHRYLN